MGTNSRIEWCDHTWNPWYCCTRVSEGCANCYMERWAKRCGRDAFGGPIPSKHRMHFPRSKKHKVGDFVFVCSLSDFFHDDAPDQWRADALAEMSQRPELVFLLLTKRIDVAERFLEEEVKIRIPDAWEILQRKRNVWLGVTAENQSRADERVPKLLGLDWPGKKFISIEPMVGPVDLIQAMGVGCCLECDGEEVITDPAHDLHPRQTGDDPDHDWCPVCTDAGERKVYGIDWVIVGGESGANARAMHPDWARSVRDQCKAAGVVFSFKQWGEYMPADPRMEPRGCASRQTIVLDEAPGMKNLAVMWRVGKKQAGKLLDGAEHLERPDSERS